NVLTDCYVVPLVVLFFFFQAEDGIRDRNVTGVQTCALPIYASEDAQMHSELLDIHTENSLKYMSSAETHMKTLEELPAEDDTVRSEERRVGKECRGRGSRDE